MDRLSIKAIRTNRGLTQSDMGKLLGVSTQTYNAWENGVEKLTISKLKAIARVLDVTLDDIFLG